MYNQMSSTTVIGQMPPQPVVTAFIQQPYLVHGKCLRGLGMTQIILGTICFTCGILALANTSGSCNFFFGYTGTGLWCGTFFILAGSLCLGVVGNPSSYCLRAIAMTFNIIADVITVIGACFSVISFIISLDYDYNYYSSWKCSSGVQSASSAMVMLLGFAEFFLALISSVLIGRGCCCQNTIPGTYIQHHPVPIASTGPTVNHAPAPYSDVTVSSPMYQLTGQSMHTGQEAIISQAAINSSNVGYAVQGTHDRVNLIDEETTVVPPPYSVHK